MLVCKYDLLDRTKRNVTVKIITGMDPTMRRLINWGWLLNACCSPSKWIYSIRSKSESLFCYPWVVAKFLLKMRRA
jgi:hypothetical protein